jgi:hypothetical protein
MEWLIGFAMGIPLAWLVIRAINRWEAWYERRKISY